MLNETSRQLALVMSPPGRIREVKMTFPVELSVRLITLEGLKIGLQTGITLE